MDGSNFLPQDVPYVVEQISNLDRIIYAPKDNEVHVAEVDNVPKGNILISPQNEGYKPANSSAGRSDQVIPPLKFQPQTVLVEDSDKESYDESIHRDSPSFVPNSVSQQLTPSDTVVQSQRGEDSVSSSFVPNSVISDKGKQVVENNNEKIANDMMVIGRFWCDDEHEAKDAAATPEIVENSTDSFTKVLSKSHKKKQKKAKNKAMKFSGYNTRYRADSQSL